MAISPVQVSIDEYDVEIYIKGKEIIDIELKSINVYLGLNKMPRAKIEFIDGDLSQQKFELSEQYSFDIGNDIEIKVGYQGDLSSIFKGIIVGQRARLRNNGASQFILECTDKALSLSIGRVSKYFEKMEDSEIIQETLGDFAGTIDSTSEKHPLIIRNNATAWDFAMLRAEVNGMIALVNNGKVDIVKPDVQSSSPLVVTFGESMIDFDLELDAQSQLNQVKTVAWDYKSQQLIDSSSSEPTTYQQGDVDGKELSKVLNVSNYTVTSTAPLTQSSLKTWADAEMVKSRMSRIRGTISFTGSALAQPNSCIDVKGINSQLNGSGYISEVEHILEKGNWVTKTTLGMSSKWFVNTHPNISESLASGRAPGIHGLQNGIVKKLDSDPEGQLRILVNIPAISLSDIGVWARFATFYATNDAGAFFLPEVGDEVIVGFLDGNPSFPIILGSLYNGNSHKAPFEADKKNTTKAIVTKQQMKIIFDEEKKIITIETPKGNKVILDDDGKQIELIDQNRNQIVMDSKGITLKSGKDIFLDASRGNVNIKAGQKVDISATQDIGLDAKMNIKCNAKMKFEGSGTMSSSLKSTAIAEVQGTTMVKINGALVKIN